MGKVGKLACMTVGLFGALYGVVTLKQQLGESAAPTDLSLEAEPTISESSPLSRNRVSHQPTILRHHPRQESSERGALYQERAAGGIESSEPEPFSPIVPAVPHQSNTPASTGAWPAENQQPTQFPARQTQSISATAAPHSLAPQMLEQATALTSGATAIPTPAPPVTVWRTAPNDSLWDISVARYGTGVYYHALFALNRSRIPRPDRLPAGIELETPDKSVLFAKYPHLCRVPDELPAVAGRPESQNPVR